MPRYRYQALDAEGNPVTGQLEAAGVDQALAQLAAEGLVVEPDGLVAEPDGRVAEPDGLVAEPEAVVEILPEDGRGGRLSVAEAVEVGGGVVELAQASLPLAPGLRAMADELGNRRVSQCLVRIAGRLEAGASLEEAINGEGPRFPAHVRGLILAGEQSGKLPEALELYVGLIHQRSDLRRRVWASVAYPLLLVVLLAALCVFLCMFVVAPFAEVYEDLGVELPLMTQWVIGLARTGPPLFLGMAGALVLGGLLLWLGARAGWSQGVLYHFPVLGPMWRWQGLAEFSQMMAIFLDEQVPLPQALRLTADGLKARRLARACLQSADMVEAGRPLSDCVDRFWEFPPTLRPLVDWGQRTSQPAETFRAAAEMFERRVSVGTTFWEVVAPPAMLVFVGGTVGVLIVSLMGPMVGLFQSLS